MRSTVKPCYKSKSLSNHFMTLPNVLGPLLEYYTFTVEGTTRINGSAGVTMRYPWGIVNERRRGTPTTNGLKGLGHVVSEISN